MIDALLGPFMPYIIGAAGALAAIFAAYHRGRSNAKKDQRIDQLESHAKTTEDIADAPRSSSYDDARARMRDRAGKP